MSFLSPSLQAATASYLDEYPRIHFAGQFFTDINTVNNYRDNYIDAIPEPDLVSGWNPGGASQWAFVDCKVTSVVYADGTATTDDPVVGKSIVNNVDSVFAKLVDLDPDCQFVSTVFGMTFGIDWKADTHEQEDSFIADWIPSVITEDIWFSRQMPYCQDCGQQTAASHTATKLEKIQWAKKMNSRALKDLKRASKKTKYLSVAASFYNYTRPGTMPLFTHGLVVGTIGVGRQEESLCYPADRVMIFKSNPPIEIPDSNPCHSAQNWMWTTYLSTSKSDNKVTVDFGNSIALDPDANICKFVPLYLGLQHTSVSQTEKVSIIGEIDYMKENEWYPRTAGVQDFTLTSKPVPLSHFVVVALLHETEIPDGDYPLCEVTKEVSMSCAFVILEEPMSYVRPMDYYVYRMEADDKMTVELFAKHFGDPDVNITVSLNGQAEEGLRYNSTNMTDSNGIVTFDFTANSITNPRYPSNLDGQIYSLSYCPTSDCSIASNKLTFHVYSAVEYERPYFWDKDVQPIFNQYERLYPVMSHILKLGDYENVTKPGNLHLLRLSMALDFLHPSYMPVTRDLSPTKQKMILEWLNSPGLYRSWEHIQEKLFEPPEFCRETVFLDDKTLLELSKAYAFDVAAEGIYEHTTLGGQDHAKRYEEMARALPDRPIPEWKKDAMEDKCTIKCLRRDLQSALDLEFYTIPLYLTSLYSVKDGYNPEVIAVIRSVVMQEMLHMAQVANMMISVGARPIIDHKDHAPKYPATGLPGGVLPGLTVSLKKASPQHMYDTFMAIEYPHKVDMKFDNISTVDAKQHTIGQFYRHVRKCIVTLGDDIFCKDFKNKKDCESKQLHWPWDMYEDVLYKVTDVKSAKQAIKMIVQQGEGASPQNPTYLKTDKLAHFYRFAELACKRHMNTEHKHEYGYEGGDIQFVPEGVWPMTDNPNSTRVPLNSQLYNRAKNFHRVYRSLLKKLQEVVEGNPDAINDSIYIMEALQIHGKNLMRDKLPTKAGWPEETCGPIFDYEWIDAPSSP